MRIAVTGNSGGGKSTLARRLAERHALPCQEIDALVWTDGWRMVPQARFAAAHQALIDGERWIAEGLGPLDSIERRFARATHIIVVDLPLWQHYWLAAERQLAWSRGELETPPAGIDEMPDTRALFKMIWSIDQEWMPTIRDLAAAARDGGTWVRTIRSLPGLSRFELPA